MHKLKCKWISAMFFGKEKNPNTPILQVYCIFEWAHTRNGPCNQDQITKAYQTKIQSSMLSQLLNKTKLMIIQFIKESKCLLCYENSAIVCTVCK